VYKSFDVGSMPLDAMIAREWLATNGVGGYASSTIPGLNTRKYHGLLVAAMAPPVRRMVLLSRLDETLRCDGWPHALSSNEYPGTVHPQGFHAIKAFSPDPFPRWAFQGENWTLQKELCLLNGQNTVCITYTLLAGNRPVSLEVRPIFALRPIHELSFQWDGRLITETQNGNSYRIPATARTPEVFFSHTGAFEQQPNWYLNTIYRREQERGYSALEDVWSAGVVRFELNAGDSAHFVCSADPHDLHAAVEQSHRQGATTRMCAMTALKPGCKAETPKTGVPVTLAVPLTGDEAVLADLIRAADQFVVRFAGDDGKPHVSSISMYPWSPPSGRSALAAFTGLFLIPGKFDEARLFLLGMASQLDRGLMPTDFPENGSAPLYLGADVSLWFINAVYAYLRYTRDEATVNSHLLDPVLRIIEQYRRGTRLGISVDASGLLKTYSPGTATTWMNAKVGDWVITPRQGRPVEVNALWYNAMCIAADLVNRFGSSAGSTEELSELSRRIKVAFNQRFWNVRAQCCHDVVGDRTPDATIRPNQLLAMSLPFPVLSNDLHATALDRVMAELVTPIGVRTLSPNDPGYVGRYSGNVVARDRATHGGSAFPWLLGPLISAYVRVNGRGDGARREARELLQDCIDYIQGDGLGQMPELFDGDVPHTPGGAVACALSVAEILRAFFEDVLDRIPHYPSAPIVRPEDVIDGVRSTPLRGQ
jgi:predicted glycogen debranching enzyme